MVVVNCTSRHGERSGQKKKIGRGGYQGHHWEHKESTEDGAAFNEVARSLG